jgi:hypothetical protein
MTFDIHQLDHLGDRDDSWKALDKYIDILLKRFAKSPEGMARLQVDPSMGYWVSQLVRFGYDYIGVTLPEMTTEDMEELLTDLFPQKISLAAPEDADDALPELIAFWEYVNREYKLIQAEAVLKYLRGIKPATFRKWMNDPSRFGMAKSLFMQGQAAGFDMTDEKEIQAFIEHYNASLIKQGDIGGPPFLDTVGGRKKRMLGQRGCARSPRHRRRRTGNGASDHFAWKGD